LPRPYLLTENLPPAPTLSKKNHSFEQQNRFVQEQKPFVKEENRFVDRQNPFLEEENPFVQEQRAFVDQENPFVQPKPATFTRQR
jgi:hypothetical protein